MSTSYVTGEWCFKHFNSGLEIQHAEKGAVPTFITRKEPGKTKNNFS